ncbi:unnamed protein product, partial [marine sediment metagenome]
DTLVWSSAVHSKMCEISAVSTDEEIAVNQVLEKLPQDMQTFKRFAYTEAFEIDGTTQVRFWFKAPSWEEIRGGTYASGRISYLVLSDDTFDFEGSTKWKSGWQYRRQITIDSDQVAEDLSNFPILVHVDGDTPGTVMEDLRDNAQDDGEDIAFTSTDGATPLFHEIEYFNKPTGELIAWVNVPNLMRLEDTILYMYYRNPGVPSQQDPDMVWNNNYVMVQHLEESSGTLFDSTSYGNDGTNTGATYNPASRIDGGYDFDDTNSEYIDVDDSFPNGNMQRTISLWFNAEEYLTSYKRPMFAYDHFTSAGSTFQINAEDNAVSILFYGHRVITPKSALLTKGEFRP